MVSTHWWRCLWEVPTEGRRRGGTRNQPAEREEGREEDRALRKPGLVQCQAEPGGAIEWEAGGRRAVCPGYSRVLPGNSRYIYFPPSLTPPVKPTLSPCLALTPAHLPSAAPTPVSPHQKPPFQMPLHHRLTCSYTARHSVIQRIHNNDALIPAHHCISE